MGSSVGIKSAGIGERLGTGVGLGTGEDVRDGVASRCGGSIETGAVQPANMSIPTTILHRHIIYF